jgi:hypothetical protein
MFPAFIVRQQCLLIKKPYQKWRGGQGGFLWRMFQLYFSYINKNIECWEFSLAPCFYVLSLDHHGDLHLAEKAPPREKFNYNIWFLHPWMTLYHWMCCLPQVRELVCKKMSSSIHLKPGKYVLPNGTMTLMASSSLFFKRHALSWFMQLKYHLIISW